MVVCKQHSQKIYPVSLDTVAYDGETKPPLGSKRSSGRPRTKRIRRRSLYAASEDSPILCSNCGQAGHNKRTCSAKTKVNKKPMGIEQFDTIIEEATDVLLRLQEENDENEEKDNGTKDEQRTREHNTESLSVP